MALVIAFPLSVQASHIPRFMIPLDLGINKCFRGGFDFFSTTEYGVGILLGPDFEGGSHMNWREEAGKEEKEKKSIQRTRSTSAMVGNAQ